MLGWIYIDADYVDGLGSIPGGPIRGVAGAG